MALEVPEEAIKAADHPNWTTQQKLTAAAPLIVAAELDRLADTFAAKLASADGGYWDATAAAEDSLRRRASVLRADEP